MVDYPTAEVRPILVEFVKDAIAEAKNLSLSDLQPDGSRGHVIAGNLCFGMSGSGHYLTHR